jgi:hypothetical protein
MISGNHTNEEIVIYLQLLKCCIDLGLKKNWVSFLARTPTFGHDKGKGKGNSKGKAKVKLSLLTS